MKMIYLAVVDTGDEEVAFEPVRAFETKERAQQFVRHVNSIVKEHWNGDETAESRLKVVIRNDRLERAALITGGLLEVQEVEMEPAE